MPVSSDSGAFSIEREIDFDEAQDDFDDGEQNLEEEAQKMLKSWDRDTLMKEAAAEWEILKRERENKKAEYYDGETEFDEMTKEMEPIGTSRSVFIKKLESYPDAKAITAVNTILYDIIGYLEFSAMPFESSIHNGKPQKLNLHEGPIVAGMLEALLQLREGERANIMIRPQMAYGHLGAPPLIPGDSTLFHQIKIYKVWDESNLNFMLEAEKTYCFEVPMVQKIATVKEHKDIANQFLRDDQPRDAIIRYKAAISCLDDAEIYVAKNDEIRALMVALLQNAAIAFNKLGMHKSASKHAKRSLFYDPTNIKAFYQLAKARIGLADFNGALQWIERANEIWPNNSNFDQLKIQLNLNLREEKSKRDEIYKRMAKGYVN